MSSDIPESLLSMLSDCKEIGSANECNGWLQRILHKRIEDAGKPFRELTIGEVLNLIEIATKEHAAAYQRSEEIRLKHAA